MALADSAVGAAAEALPLCWLIMATAIALESACTFPDTPATLEELPVAIMHGYKSTQRSIKGEQYRIHGPRTMYMYQYHSTAISCDIHVTNHAARAR